MKVLHMRQQEVDTLFWRRMHNWIDCEFNIRNNVDIVIKMDDVNPDKINKRKKKTTVQPPQERINMWWYTEPSDYSQ